MARYRPANMDMESLRYQSWCLSRLLDKIIGTKEIVLLTRKHLAMYSDMHDAFISHKFFLSGSRGEGFRFQSSDFDYMYIDRDTTILESVHSVDEDDDDADDDTKTILLMIREGCNPGFVILQLLNRTHDPAIRLSVVDCHGIPVVSSLLYRDEHRDAERGEVGHGPCNTYSYTVDEDIAYCFRCKKWPTEAHEFIFRQRLHGLPEQSLLDKIVSTGCHLVPVGDKHSNLSSVQWRLSFSAAEKDLVHSFNHTQFLVYGLLKLFLKQFINTFQLVKDILCSYFIKTAMFYCIEMTPSSFWRDDLLLPCFWFCLNKLTQWVEQGYCPNYFVPQNNMFRGKVVGENQRNLFTFLTNCKHVGWRCLCECEILQPLQNLITDPELVYNLCTRIENQREYKSDTIVFLALKGCTSTTPTQIARGLTLLRHSRTQLEENISTLLLYSKFRNAGMTNACINVGISNKAKYRKSYPLLLMSANSNIYTGVVYLATFYYITRQYRKAIHLSNRIISQWKPYVTYDSKAHRLLFNDVMYNRYVCGRSIGVIDKAKLAFAFDIVIFPGKRRFFPVELSHDIQAATPFEICLPPIPYTVFLLFLCHHKLGNIDDSVTTLHDLRVLLRDEQQGCRRYPTVLNMLAVCQDKLGDVQGAIETCLLSQTLKPDRNGAVQILEKLLRKQ